jgi:hypothetical protein
MDHTIYVREGNVNNPAQANTNPSVAQSPTQGRGVSPIGTALKATVYIQAGKQLMSNTISNIGFVTGNYELQETAETIASIGALAIGLVAAPIPTIIATSISTGFEIWAIGVTQRRNQYKQQQAQVLTGKISVNGGRW